MSTFTDWNGPQGGSGIKASDLTAYTNAFITMKSALEDHIAKEAADTDVHEVAAYVKSKLDSILPDYVKTSDAEKTYLSQSTAGTDYLKKAEASTIYQSKPSSGEYFVTNENIKTLSEDIAKTYATKGDYITSSVATEKLNKKADKTELDTISTAVSGNTTTINNLKESKVDVSIYNEHINSHDTDEKNNLILKNKLVDKNKLDLFKVVNISDKTCIEIGNQEYIPVITQRMAFYNGKDLDYYPLQGELGTVPVGGIIEWPIDWVGKDLNLSEGNSLSEKLKLPDNGEWLPCNGAAIPMIDEYKDLRNLLGKQVGSEQVYKLPNIPKKIIHAKAAAKSTNKEVIHLADMTVLPTELGKKIDELNAIIESYKNVINNQNAYIKQNEDSLFIHSTKDLPNVHNGGAFESNIKSEMRKNYAKKEALENEILRAQLSEKYIHTQVLKEVDNKATWQALNNNIRDNGMQHQNLEEHIIAEHIGAHDAESALDKRISDVESSIKKLNNIIENFINSQEAK